MTITMISNIVSNICIYIGGFIVGLVLIGAIPQTGDKQTGEKAAKLIILGWFLLWTGVFGKCLS